MESQLHYIKEKSPPIGTRCLGPSHLTCFIVNTKHIYLHIYCLRLVEVKLLPNNESHCICTWYNDSGLYKNTS